MSLGTSANTAAIPTARPPLSRSTTAHPLVTPNNTFGVQAGLEEQSQIQAALVLSRIALKNSLQRSKTAHSMPRRHSQESADCFERNVPEKLEARQVNMGGCEMVKSQYEARQGNDCRPKDLSISESILASTYFSFPDFDSNSDVSGPRMQHQGQLSFNPQQVIV